MSDKRERIASEVEKEGGRRSGGMHRKWRKEEFDEEGIRGGRQ